MARRRTQQTSPAGCFVPLAVVLVLGVIGLLESAAAGSPGAIFVLLLLVGGGVAAGAIVLRRRRQAELQAAHDYQIAVARSQQIAPYHSMAPREFEQALAFLCGRDGCTDARVVGGAGDLGADVIATAPDGRRIVIQAKRYSPTNKVTGPDLQKFGGTCYSVHDAQVAAVVTTSTFTKQARQYAQHMGIRLVDDDELAGWVSRTGPAPWH